MAHPHAYTDKSEETVTLALSALRLSRKIVIDAVEADGWPGIGCWDLFWFTIVVSAGLTAAVGMLSIPLVVQMSDSDKFVLLGLIVAIVACGVSVAVEVHPLESLLGEDHPKLRRWFRPIARVISCYTCKRSDKME